MKDSKWQFILGLKIASYMRLIVYLMVMLDLLYRVMSSLLLGCSLVYPRSNGILLLLGLSWPPCGLGIDIANTCTGSL